MARYPRRVIVGVDGPVHSAAALTWAAADAYLRGSELVAVTVCRAYTPESEPGGISPPGGDTAEHACRDMQAQLPRQLPANAAPRVTSLVPHGDPVEELTRAASARDWLRALVAPAVRPARFASAVAEHLPFVDGLFDLAVVTLSVSHWSDKAAGLAEISRVMAPNATLVAADVLPAPLSRPMTIQGRRRKLAPSLGLPSLIAASGLCVEHVEPIRSVTLVANAALIAAKKPC